MNEQKTYTIELKQGEIDIIATMAFAALVRLEDELDKAEFKRLESIASRFTVKASDGIKGALDLGLRAMRLAKNIQND